MIALENLSIDEIVAIIRKDHADMNTQLLTYVLSFALSQKEELVQESTNYHMVRKMLELDEDEEIRPSATFALAHGVLMLIGDLTLEDVANGEDRTTH